METKNIVVLTGYSGVGKGKATEYALEYFSQLMRSRSVTTRPPRPKEVRGREYDYWDDRNRPSRFIQAVQDKYFLEWNYRFGGGKDGYYGTPVSEIPRIWGLGKVPLLDVEINGALAIRKEFEGKANLTFVPILPSSDELWEQILRERSAKDGCRPADVEARIKNAPMEKARMKAEFPEADFVENDYDKLFYNRIVNRVLQGLPSYVTI
jgi:guanylate kinase